MPFTIIEISQQKERKAKEKQEKKERLLEEIGKELLDNSISGLEKRVQEIMGQYILLEQHFIAICVQKVNTSRNRLTHRHISIGFSMLTKRLCIREEIYSAYQTLCIRKEMYSIYQTCVYKRRDLFYKPNICV